jgi:hypothetical protein
MSTELQEAFLSYGIAVDQLVNASDSEVLEVFARLNSYNVTLNAAELRHARFSGDFKWAVHEAAGRWDVLWTRFEIISKRQRLRMLDDSLMAEMFGVLLHGVTSGDQQAITRLYQEHDPAFPEEQKISKQLDQTLEFITENLSDVIAGPMASPPHFLLIFASVGHALIGLPPGQMGDRMPVRNKEVLSDLDMARSNLSRLGAAIENRETEGPLGRFVLAFLANAHRMASREVRFPMFYAALLPRQIGS